MELTRTAQLALLLDFYGALLTDRQRQMLRLRVE